MYVRMCVCVYNSDFEGQNKHASINLKIKIMKKFRIVKKFKLVYFIYILK